MGTFIQDLRYGIRVLAKSPGFTAVAVLTLALGIGANAAIFSVVYVSLLRPLPYAHPERLLAIGEGRSQSPDDANVTSHPDYLDWKRTAKSFQSIAAYGFDAFTLSGNGDPKNVFAIQATPNFFSTLGVKPVLGRDFLDGEDVADGPHVAILSYAVWRTEFGGDPNVIGRSYRLDANSATIVGVLPRNFEFAPASVSSSLWVPLHAQGDLDTRRSLRWLHVVARLAPRTTEGQARAEMDAITAQLARAYPREHAATFVAVAPLREKIIGKVRPLLLVLFGTVGFVLLIACANLANLLMTRSVGRQREFAIRTALGAGRAALVRQLLAESLLLALLGAAAGLLLAQWGVTGLISAIPDVQLQAMPYLRDASLNVPVLAFAIGLTVLTAVAFGLAPGLAVSESPVGEILKDQTRGATSATHSRLRNSFVVGEVAISLVLLVGAALMLRSFRALVRTSPGFDPHNILTLSVNLPDASYPSDKAYPFNSPAAIRFTHQFEDRLRALPGVEAAGLTTNIPMGGGGGSIRFVVEGRPVETGKEDECQIRTVDSSYLPMLKVPLVKGRFFNDAADSPDGPASLIVNQAFVKRHFADEQVLGKRIRFTFNAKEPYRQIVGVVGNMAEGDLSDPPEPVIYYPNDQGPSTFLTFLVRTQGDPAAFVGTVRSTLKDMDSQLALIQPQSLEQVANDSEGVFLRRYPSYLIGSFAAIALILAVVGLYGQLSYTVQQRTREIGIRVAFGAQRRDIVNLVLRQGMTAALAGVCVGIAAGLALTRLMASLLYGVRATDGPTFAGVAILLTLVAVAACLIPARRAMRVDPIVALRHE